MAKAVAILAALLVVVAAAMRTGGAPPPPPCDVSNLSSCAGAFLFGLTPLPTCCTKLREEELKGCLCVYANDPQYNGFLNSSTARKALAYCKVAYPTGC